jgi:hypothetical protein
MDKTGMLGKLDWSFFILVFLFQKTRIEGAIEKSEITLSVNFFWSTAWGGKSPPRFFPAHWARIPSDKFKKSGIPQEIPPLKRIHQ